MKNNELNEMLNEWKLDLVEDRDFKREVWNRIEFRRSTIAGQWIEAVVDQLFRPRVAVPVLVSVLSISMISAFAHGQRDQETFWVQLATEYERSITPEARFHAVEKSSMP